MAEAAIARVQGRTGTKCTKSGPYRSSANARVVIFVKQGDTFLPDANGAATTWVLMSSEDRW
jgi:hypothetical protein